MNETTRYTERDLARIAVARQAARLADSLHELVGKHGHDVGPGTWLGALVSPLLGEAEKLRGLAIAYERRRGTSWRQIGEILGLEAAEAAARWGLAAEQAPPEDIDAAVAELNHWYLRHLWLDADAASVANPLSRLLDAGAGDTVGADAACLICRKYAGGMVPAWAGTAVPPGGHLIDDAMWRVGHAPTVFAPRGSLLVESRRHFLDFAEMTKQESASYADLVGRLCGVIKPVTGAERIHVFSSMDGTPHFHVWLLPRRPQDVKGRRFMLEAGYCTEQEAAAAVGEMRALLDQN